MRAELVAFQASGDGEVAAWGPKVLRISLLERSLEKREDGVVATIYREKQQLSLRALPWEGAVVGDGRSS